VIEHRLSLPREREEWTPPQPRTLRPSSPGRPARRGTLVHCTTAGEISADPWWAQELHRP
jgi:hypothetical protein